MTIFHSISQRTRTTINSNQTYQSQYDNDSPYNGIAFETVIEIRFDIYFL